jgi:hypothetical protein
MRVAGRHRHFRNVWYFPVAAAFATEDILAPEQTSGGHRYGRA